MKSSDGTERNIWGTEVLYEWRWTGWFGLESRVISVGWLRGQERDVEGSELQGLLCERKRVARASHVGFFLCWNGKGFLKHKIAVRTCATAVESADSRCFRIVENFGILEVLWRQRDLMIDAFWFKKMYSALVNQLRGCNLTVGSSCCVHFDLACFLNTI